MAQYFFNLLTKARKCIYSRYIHYTCMLSITIFNLLKFNNNKVTNLILFRHKVNK